MNKNLLHIKKIEGLQNFLKRKWKHALTTPEAPAVMAIGAVTALNPDAHITGIFTAREIVYAAASVGFA